MDDNLWLGQTRIDLNAGRVYVGDGPGTRLSPAEIGLLRHLRRRAPAVVPRRELLTEVLGYDPAVSSRAVHHAVARLRRKVEPDPAQPRFLVSVRGVGLRLVLEPPVADRTRLHVRQFAASSTAPGAWTFDAHNVLVGRVPELTLLDDASRRLAGAVETLRSVVGDASLSTLCLPQANALSRLSAVVTHRRGKLRVTRLPSLRLELWVRPLDTPHLMHPVADHTPWLPGAVELRFGDVADPYLALFAFAGSNALVRYEGVAAGLVPARPPAVTWRAAPEAVDRAARR